MGADVAFARGSFRRDWDAADSGDHVYADLDDVDMAGLMRTMQRNMDADVGIAVAVAAVDADTGMNAVLGLMARMAMLMLMQRSRLRLMKRERDTGWTVASGKGNLEFGSHLRCSEEKNREEEGAKQSLIEPCRRAGDRYGEVRCGWVYCIESAWEACENESGSIREGREGF